MAFRLDWRTLLPLTRIEMRRAGKPSWLPRSRFLDDGAPDRALLLYGDALDHNWLDRHVSVRSAVAGADFGDFVHHVHPIRNLAEGAVAKTRVAFVAVIEKAVVLQIDEELGG